MCIACELGFSSEHTDAAAVGGVAAGTPAAAIKPSLTTAQAVTHIAEAAWSSPSTAVSYAFRSTSADAAFQRFTSVQISAAELALQLWSDVANIQFQRVGVGVSGEAAYSNDASMLFNALTSSASFAYAYYPGSRASNSVSGDVFLNVGYSSLYNMSLGSYSFMTMVHEIGHAIGLSHPGAYNAGSGGAITYSNSAEYMQDTRQYSVMSYFEASATGASHGGLYASTPLLHDIAALQSLYGANTSTRSGDTVYGFNSNADRPTFSLSSGSQRAVFAIWDGFGNDTLDLSGYGQAQNISLLADTFSDAGGLTKNIAIAQGVVIENAVGGSGKDVITGNAARNVLQARDGDDLVYGLAGNDVLYGEAGNDSLDGGAGDDVLFGGTGADWLAGGEGTDLLFGGDGGDTFVIASYGPLDVIADFSVEDRIYIVGFDEAPDGTTFIWNPDVGILSWDPDAAGWHGFMTIVRMQYGGPIVASNIMGARKFDLRTEYLFNDLLGSDGADLLQGGGGRDRLLGGSGDDELLGAGGDDELHGEEGSDKLRGDDGNDLLGGGHGNDHLFGGNGDDRLIAGTGNDELHGEEGDDELHAEDGNDRLGGGHGNDRLYGGDGEDHIVGGTGNDKIFGQKGHDALEGEDGQDELSGGDGDDVLSGGDGEDILSGDAGNDTIYGQKGHDKLDGGAGDDRLYGHEGDDLLDGGEGSDRLEGGSGNDRLMGGKGDDVLTGGDGADTFVVSSDCGLDIITDFLSGDAIEFRDGRFGSFETVKSRAVQSGNDTVIYDDGGQLVLQHVALQSLDADHFRFV